MNMFCLKRPELLSVEDENGSVTAGGDQMWFPKTGFIPPGACGATVASALLAYCLRSRPDAFDLSKKAGIKGLADPLCGTVNKKSGYIEFMKIVYPFFRPRIGGLMSDAFVRGMADFGSEFGLPFSAERLLVPVARPKRPPMEEIGSFISETLADDMPAAFLILSAGRANGLENWHWVTILEYDAENARAKIADNCIEFWTNIKEWHGSTIMGGSFVRVLLSGV